MNDSTDNSISQSMEIASFLLPYLPELVKDLWDMGCAFDQILDLIKSLNQPGDTNLLDLGCGKGAVCIRLASELGFRTVGVDACLPFLEEAEKKAKEFQVSNRSRFIMDDIRIYADEAENYDVVVYASLGNILGNFEEIVLRLRSTIHKGGYILIDDGFLKAKKKLEGKGYEHYRSHTETVKQLTSHGDSLLKEVILPDQVNAAVNARYMQAIENSGAGIMQREPHLKDAILKYIENQKLECRIIEEHLTGAVWLLQRTD
jgi:2-polyprenyl-3-methyl-5-hydroxy-6-metoxy-1,4-benzoquinol methylase